MSFHIYIYIYIYIYTCKHIHKIHTWLATWLAGQGQGEGSDSYPFRTQISTLLVGVPESMG